MSSKIPRGGYPLPSWRGNRVSGGSSVSPYRLPMTGCVLLPNRDSISSSVPLMLWWKPVSASKTYESPRDASRIEVERVVSNIGWLTARPETIRLFQSRHMEKKIKNQGTCVCSISKPAGRGKPFLELPLSCGGFFSTLPFAFFYQKAFSKIVPICHLTYPPRFMSSRPSSTKSEVTSSSPTNW